MSNEALEAHMLHIFQNVTSGRSSTCQVPHVHATHGACWAPWGWPAAEQPT